MGREGRLEEPVLVAEVGVDHRLVAARRGGDAVDPGACDAQGRELAGRGGQQPPPGPVRVTRHPPRLATNCSVDSRPAGALPWRYPTSQLVARHPEVPMAKTWLITGSSRGLGRELAQAAAGRRGQRGRHGAPSRVAGRPRGALRRPDPARGPRRHRPGGGPRGRPGGGDGVRVPRRGGEQRGLRHLRVHRGPAGGGVPGPAGHQPVRRGQRDQGGPAGAPRAALGAHHPGLVHRGPGRRDPRDGRLPDSQVRRGGVFRGPQQRGPAAGHQGHHRGARRVPHRLGWLVHAHPAGQRGLRADRGRDEPLPPGGGRPAAGRPGPGRGDHHRDRPPGPAAAAAAAGLGRGAHRRGIGPGPAGGGGRVGTSQPVGRLRGGALARWLPGSAR